MFPSFHFLELVEQERIDQDQQEEEDEKPVEELQVSRSDRGAQHAQVLFQESLHGESGDGR